MGFLSVVIGLLMINAGILVHHGANVVLDFSASFLKLLGRLAHRSEQFGQPLGPEKQQEHHGDHENLPPAQHCEYSFVWKVHSSIDNRDALDLQLHNRS